MTIISIIYGQSSCNINNNDKTDCGFVGITQQQCQSKGCCWDEVYDGSSTPWCFHGSISPPSTNFTGPPFNETAMQYIWKYFIANIDIDGKGGVVASPDTNTGQGGSYYYHWMRDGALSMNTYMMVTNFTYHSQTMKNYVQWVLNVQNEKDPNNIDIRTEPKFNLPNGDVFTGDWCRPQTDGSALRAITLSHFAFELIKNNELSYVNEYLWTNNNNYNGGAIKYDLDWVVNNWSQNGCDLWEEIQSTDFFWNRMAFKKALLIGYQIALKQGDTSLANTYLSTAQQINSTLINHYNGQYVFESTNRQQDACVICAFNDGYTRDGLYSATDYRVSGTINTLNNLFNNAFPINNIDTNNGVPGVLYGRYQGDTYDGGNPWILTTNALAQLYYRYRCGYIPSIMLQCF